MIFDAAEISTFNVEPWATVIDGCRGKEFRQFRAIEGYNYRTFIWLAHEMAGELFLDLGTKRGASAFALGSNKLNRVKSWDIDDAHRKHAGYAWPTIAGYDNIEFLKEDVMGSLADVPQARVISLDVSHDGETEKRYYEALCELGFKGILFMDDIDYPKFATLREFWGRIEKRKEILPWAHYSGLGVVYFE